MPEIYGFVFRIQGDPSNAVSIIAPNVEQARLTARALQKVYRVRLRLKRVIRWMRRSQ